MKRNTILKEYLRLIIENEEQAEVLIQREEAESLIASSLREPISNIIKIISEKNLFDFIEYYPLKSFKREARNFLMDIKGNDLDEAISYRIALIFENLSITERDGSEFVTKHFLESYIEDELKICAEAEKSLQILAKKVEEDEVSDFSETTKSDAPLGKIVFPSLRQDAPLEKNTAVETTLQNAIYGHIIRNKKLKSKDAQLIKSLVSGNYYPKWFSEPTAEIIYRGMSVPKRYIANILGKEPNEVPGSGEEELDWTFNPLEETSSWSMNEDEADSQFALEGSGVAFLMSAKVSENPDKFVDLEKLYGISSFMDYSDEQEVIAIGQIKVFKIRWGF
jgi:hypothetical protein